MAVDVVACVCVSVCVCGCVILGRCVGYAGLGRLVNMTVYLEYENYILGS